MGLELTALVRLTPADGKPVSGESKVLLETNELILRGEVRAKIPRPSVRDAVEHSGIVTVKYEGGTLALTLGNAAGKFVKKLLEPPRSRLDKMGITAGSRVVIVGLDDPDFHAELKTAGAIAVTRAGKSEALIVAGISSAADLTRIAACAKLLAPDGALWAIHPKGATGVKDTDIFAAAMKSGLTYTKVARFSDTHTAEKLVIPKAARKK